MNFNHHITKGSYFERLKMSLGNKGGGTQRNGLEHNGERGRSCEHSSSMSHISEEQAPAHTGFVIPGGLFVHNIKGHLELATEGVESCLKNGHRKAASEDGLSLGRVELLGLPVDHCCKKCRRGRGAFSHPLSFLSLGPFVSFHPAVSLSLLPSFECRPWSGQPTYQANRTAACGSL